MVCVFGVVGLVVLLGTVGVVWPWLVGMAGINCVVGEVEVMGLVVVVGVVAVLTVVAGDIFLV